MAAATIGQPFSYNAPYILGWNLADGEAATKVINSVMADDTITFKYTQTTGNVLVVLKEGDSYGRIIKTLSAGETLTASNSPMTIPIPDLSGDNYTRVPGQSVKSVEYKPNVPLYTVEYYYTKDTRDVNAAAYGDGGTLLATLPQGAYRVGEVATILAPMVNDHKLLTATPQNVIVVAGSGAQEVRFDYTSKANVQDEIVIEAVTQITPGNYAILQSFSLTGNAGESLMASAPVIAGYALKDGESASKTAIVPSIVTFEYVRNVVTVTVKLKDSDGNAIAAPAGVQTSYVVAKGSDFTAYAPHIPGYELAGAQSAPFTNITTDQEVTFTYVAREIMADKELVPITVTGMDMNDPAVVLYSYITNREKNSGAFDVTAPPVYGYVLDPSTPSPATLNVGSTALSLTFYYDSLATQVTILAVDNATHAVLQTIMADALIGQPFTYTAPSIPGYAVHGGVYVMTIASVTADSKLAFQYDAIPDNGTGFSVTVTLVDADSGDTIMSYPVAVDLNSTTTIPVPDLSASFYTALDSPEQVTFDGTESIDVVYRYQKMTRQVNVTAYDITNGANSLIETVPLTDAYRVGEYATIDSGALTKVADMVLIGLPAQYVFIQPGTDPQEVRFNYMSNTAATVEGKVLVRAINNDTNLILSETTVSGANGSTIQVSAPVIDGYKLIAGETQTKTAAVPSTVVFKYETSQSQKPKVDPFKTDDGNISGTGVPGASVKVTFADGSSETATANPTTGKWSVPNHKGNKTITVVQSQLGKDPSDPVTVTATSADPVVNSFMSDDPKISGTGTNGSTVTVIFDDDPSTAKTVDVVNGKWSVDNIPGARKVTVTQNEQDKQPSNPITRTATTEKPGVDPFKSDDPNITGTGTDGSSVTVMFDDNPDTAVTVPVVNGTWSAPNLPGSKKVTVTQTAPGKSASEPIDKLATSSDPTVDNFTLDDNNITGTGTSGSAIVVTFSDGSTETVTVGGDGNWSVKNHKGNNKVTVVQTEDGKGSSDPVVRSSTDTASSEPGVNDFSTDDDTITGRGAPGATITVEFPDGIETTTVNGDGDWSVPNHKGSPTVRVTQKEPGKAGNTIVVSASAAYLTVIVNGPDGAPMSGVSVTFGGQTYTSDDQGMVSKRVFVGSYNVVASKEGYVTSSTMVTLTNLGASTTISLAEASKSAKPGVDPFKSDDQNITGTGAPGSTVTVVFNDDPTTAVTVPVVNGKWTVPNLPGNSSKKVTVTQKAPGLNPSDPIEKLATSSDPTVDDFTLDDNNITGTGTPGSAIVVTFSDGSTETVKSVGNDGHWSVPNKKGSTSVSVVQTEPGKGASDPVEKSATTNESGMPGVDEFAKDDDAITGTGTPGATIIVKYGDGSSETTTVNDQGKWSVPNHKGNTSITVTQKEPGKNSKTTPTLTATDKTTDAPTVNPFAPGDSTITGKGTPGATVTVEFPDGTETTTVGQDGNWSVSTAGHNNTTSVKVTQKEKGKNGVTITVTAAAAYLSVKVTDSKGAALQGVSVTFGGKTYTTDQNGMVDKQRLDFGTYRIVATKTGFNSGSATAVLSLTNANALVTISLSPPSNTIVIGGGGGGGYGPGVVYVTVPGETQPPEPPITPPTGTTYVQYLFGYPDGTVRPDAQITRAEVAALLFRLSTDLNKAMPMANVFRDVDPNAWYAQAVNYLASRGIIVGYGDGTFKPNQTITRAELAVIVSKYLGLANTSTSAFPDVQSGHWAAGYINSAYAQGIVVGYPDGMYRPDNKITRAETIVIINRMFGRRSVTGSLPVNIPRLFSDLTVAHWAYADIIDASTLHTAATGANGYEIWQTVSGTPAILK
ncbi:MAG: Ig-like domain-containing protein [Firmicutes bacterium]|nr:Ig-like domain-containing protein [Bacillota bacterium]